MKVLLVTLEYPPIIGGVSTYLRELYEGRDDVEVEIISPNTHQMFVWWMWPKWIPFYFNLKKHVSEHRPDEIHVSHVLPIGMMAYWLKKKFNIPYTIIYHGLDLHEARKQPRKWKHVEKIAYAAQRTIVNSEATLELCKQWLPKLQSVFVIAPGAPKLSDVKAVGLDELRDAHNLHNTRVILFLARLVERKGVFLALDSYQLLLNKNIEATLVIAGDGPERVRAEQYAQKLGIADRVRFVGVVSEEDKWRWFSIAQLFWFPAIPRENDIEGFGMTSLEAQACGCPVVVSNLGGLPESVLNNVSGMVVEPNAASFVEATEYILLDSSVWQRMRVAARAFAAQNSWDIRRELFKKICE